MSTHQQQAAATVTAAVEQHARLAGLLPQGMPLAVAHPALSVFADVRYNPGVYLPATAPAPPPSWTWCTRYLGDLYQQESTEARKGRALCQTPQFVSRLLLDCTWANAVHELWREPYPVDSQPLPLRGIDPACGTGHLLVDLLHEAFVASQMRGIEESVRDALSVVHGVDLDPFAVAVARYRLLSQACQWLRCRLDEAPVDLPIHVAAGNSLLPDQPALAGTHNDLELHPEILADGRYDVVVANPPYITVKDKAMRDAVRDAYPQVCHGKYSLAVPFEPLMHRLAKPGGWVARITANSFMKREFGRPLVEKFFPTIDLQWIIDTSGAYIPGHGTPTVILVSRNRAPGGGTIRTVLGVRGEPRQPDRPENGVVWRAIEDRVHAWEQGRRQASDMRHEDALLDDVGSVELDTERVKPVIAPLPEPEPWGQYDLFGVAS